MAGAITSSSLGNPGSGYSPGDNPNVVQGTNNSASVFVLTVDGGGAVLTYLQDGNDRSGNGSSGCGYVVQSGVPTGPGGGTGLTINILSVGPGTDATHGQIGTNSLNNGGSGYADGDTGTIVQGGNTSGSYNSVIQTGGVVTGYNVDPADGYAVGTATTIAATGVGSGLIINILNVTSCASGPPPSTTGYMNSFF